MIVKRLQSVFRAGGVAGVLAAIVRRVRMPHARCFQAVRVIVTDAIGIEVGGPSPMFGRGGLMPLYPVAKRVDNVNFAYRTVWEGTIQEGDSFAFHPGKAPGRQFIAEGANLEMVPAGSYDFVLSCHMLEHTANPLGALAGWAKVLRPGGSLVLVVPHRDGTFDHRRPVTRLEHLLDDLRRNMGESDLTHLPEILDLHDLSMDPGADTAASFRARGERNAEFRSLHHHVFDTRLAVAAVSQAGFEPIEVELLQPYHIVVLARKRADPSGPGRAAGIDLGAVLGASPFPTDRA
jgi:SAM-dependent methyltransferase